MDIKLIGLDLDHTTLNSQGNISRRTKEALESAISKGINVIIATGRSFHSMPEDVYKIKGLKYTVNSNGAEIRTIEKGEVMYQNYILAKEIEEICHYLERRKNMIEVFVDGHAYIGENVYKDIESGRKLFRSREYVMKTRKTVSNIYKFLIENRFNVENINIFFDKKTEKEQMWEELRNIENVTITSSLPFNLEIGGSTTSKATAIKYIADILEIGQSEIMCCGDSHNDIEMLRFAKVSVAVSNSEEEVKRISNYHTDSNDEDGVAKAIEKLIL